MKKLIFITLSILALTMVILLPKHSYGASPSTKTDFLPDNYEEAKPFSEGLAPVKDGSGKWGYINRTGKLVIAYKYDVAGKFSQGLATVAVSDESGVKKYGYINKSNRTVIPLNFETAYQFSEGMACVRRSTPAGSYEFGYIDKKGKMVIPYKYGDALKFSQGMACVLGKSQSGTLKYGFIDKSGNVAIPFMYDVAYSFSDGLACVLGKGDGNKMKYGYINSKNETVIPFQYGDAFMFSNGVATVMQDNKYVVIDTSGNVVFSHGNGVIKEFSNDMALVRNENLNKYGYADKEGNVKIDYKYYEAYPFSEGLACVVQGMGYDKSVRRYGYIDVNGNTVIPPQFKFQFERADFSQGFACVKLDTGKYAFLRNPLTGGKIDSNMNKNNKSDDPVIATPVMVVSNQKPSKGKVDNTKKNKTNTDKKTAEIQKNVKIGKAIILSKPTTSAKAISIPLIDGSNVDAEIDSTVKKVESPSLKKGSTKKTAAPIVLEKPINKAKPVNLR